MNKSDENKNKMVKFYTYPPMEFLQAMYAIAKEEELNKVFHELNIVPDEEFKCYINMMKSKLSRYLIGELKYFFQMTEAVGHIFPSFIVNNPEIMDVSKLIKFIEETDENAIIFYLVRSVLSENCIENCKELNWENMKHNLSGMIELVKYSIIKDGNIKEKLLECLKNPGETKQRYCLMLKSFYKNAFQLYENKIMQRLEIGKARYEKSFNENAEEFFNCYFKSDVVNCYIHVSLFKHTGWLTYNCEEETNDKNWIVLGIFSYKVLGNAARKERVNKFFKLLSDKKRVRIIELIANRRCYGHEIAEYLKITPATVSYHIGFLIELDIVSFQRDDGRLYYSLDKNKMEQLFNEAKEYLLLK